MKKNLLLILAICVTGLLSVNAQVGNLTPEQLKADKDKKVEEIKTLQADIDKLDAELATMDFSGWKFGGNGGVAFSGAGASNWQVAGDPIVNGLTTNITINAFANMTEDKYYWYNGGNLQLGYLTQWAKLTDDFSLSDGTSQTLDKLYISSLGGYRINSELAATALLDVQTALGNFADPATISGGLGVTWTPVQTMDGKLIPLKVVFHPLTWKGTYIKSDYSTGTDTTGAYINGLRYDLGLDAGKHLASDFGLKIVADYARTIKILGNSIGWTTQLRAFAPYTQIEALIPGADGSPIPSLEEPTGPMEVNWDNAFSINLFKNLAISANWNLRNFKPETAFLFKDADPDNNKNWQHLWNFGFGLSTTF